MENKDMKSTIDDFVKKQLKALELEEEEEEKLSITRINQFSAKQLETLGVCIRKLEVVSIEYSSYGKYLTEFCKKNNSDFENKISRYKFDNGDEVGLFTYNDKINDKPLFKGIVHQFDTKKIVVDFDEEINEKELPKNICLVQLVNKVTYERIKNGLEKLKENHYHEKTNKLINILFDNDKPTFDESKEKLEQIKNIEFFNPNLNESQKEAVKFALKINEVGLIHGPPGTGKTTTGVEIILQLCKLGKKILVVAPSNIAIDNICEKLIKYKDKFKKLEKNKIEDFDICRIGHPARLLPTVIDNSLDSLVENSEEIKFLKKVKSEIKKINNQLDKLDYYKDKEKRIELKGMRKEKWSEIKNQYRTATNKIFSNSKVLLATCAGSGENSLCYLVPKELPDAPFEYVIIDEAAQATEALCYIPILKGQKLILLGDHLQLPPTIKNVKAEKILSFTLFDRLIKLYGDKIKRMLNIQYRMNEEIMKYSSEKLYEDKLIADDSVAKYTLEDLVKDKNKEDFENIKSSDEWELIDKPLVLVDTSGLELYETLDQETLSSFNIGECEICKRIIDYLRNNLKVDLKGIGVITPYNAQVASLCKKIPHEEYEGIEISTVDGFQGREKEIIILSLVRSNKTHQVGFLSEKRRLNVAITRAKRMLITIGDIETIINCQDTKGNKEEFLEEYGTYCLTNASSLNIIGTIMEYNDYEDLKGLCIEEKKIQDKVKEEKIEKSEKEQNKKGIKNKEDNNSKGNNKKGKKKKK